MSEIKFETKQSGTELLRYHKEEDCIEIKVPLGDHPVGTKFYPTPVVLSDEELKNEVRRIVEVYVDEIDERSEKNVGMAFSDLIR